MKDNEQIEGTSCHKFGSAANTKGNPQFSDLQTKEECNRYEEEDDDLESLEQQGITRPSQSEVEQSTINVEISESSRQKHFIKLEQQHKNSFLIGFYDPIADYLELISSVDIKIFFSDDSWFHHPLKLHCCMLGFHLFFESRSRISSADQLLAWIHWKHDVT